MSIAKCPKCREQVTVPPYSERQLRVRCPLCAEEYILGDVLDNMPPALILLDPPPMAPVAAPSSELQVMDEPQPVVAGGFSFQESAAPQVPLASPAPARLKTTPRPKKKAANPIVEVGKIVGGGLLGIALAILILWWNPWKPTDIGNLGKNFVSKYAPWIVPARFHGAPSENNNNTASIPKQQSPAVAANTNPKPAPTPQPDSNKKPEPAKPTPEPSDLSLPDFSSATTNSDEPKIELPNVDPFAADPPKPKPAKPEPTETTDPSLPLDLPVAKTTPPPEDTFGKGLKEFQTATTTWKDYEGNDRNELIKMVQNWYASLVRLADEVGKPAINDVDRGELQIAFEAALELQLKGRPAFTDMVASRGKSWIAKPDRTSDGIAIYGVIKESSATGDWFTTTVGDSTLVVSKSDPAEILPPGQSVLVLGKIIENPATNLEGYQGDAKKVVLDVFHMVRPK